MRASGATISAKLAFEFLVLTADRSGEVRLARWEEIDLDAAEWRLPAVRLNANREHTVPLSRGAVEILNEAAASRDDSDLVHPSARGKPLSDKTLSKPLKEQGIAAVPHGSPSRSRRFDETMVTGEMES